MNLKWISCFFFLFFSFTAFNQSTTHFHVSPNGKDANPGTEESPFKTISAAAKIAQAGDIITVHEGVYRERVNPLHGGTSDDKRIIYQAAEGEKVVIKGSERVKGWKKVKNDTWKAILPESFFGEFNPYRDTIWGDWFIPKGRKYHTGAVYLDGHWLTEAATMEEVMTAVGETPFWFTKANKKETTIWAQFKGIDPNQSEVEVNVRQSVFYPDKPGINFITVRGFVLEHAATPWAPPTAEQVGLIGTHWSKGWIIENNIIRYSTCVGVTLGKYGDEYDNTSQNAAEGYVKTIERAVEVGWTGDKIGHHLVRNNKISHCEQAGIVGSLGAIFSKIIDNEIHDIHVRKLFSGHEMAGIKIHGAIDGVIRGNHIYRTYRGIWLDWMTQGTRVSGNLLHHNGTAEDIFVEVNHGPYLIDNNICLSPKSLLVNSQGGAYVHNLMAGNIRVLTGEKRLTPFHKAHTTELAGLSNNASGDERFYNNIFTGIADMSPYDKALLPVLANGNVYLNGAKSPELEKAPMVAAKFDPLLKLYNIQDAFFLEFKANKKWAKKRKRPLITTAFLGKAITPDLPFEQFDGQPYKIDKDYLGRKRKTKNPFPGPFIFEGKKKTKVKVWPVRE